MESTSNKYQITFETWNKVAKLYEEKFMDLDLYNESYAIFCSLITHTNPAILEVGCGPGNITKYLLNARPDFKILATDISPNMIALAEKNNPTASFKVFDTREIDLLNTKFDAIIAGFCLPYLSETDCTKFIENCNSLLNDKGIVYISFVEGDYNNSGYKAGSTGDKTYFYYHSLASIENELLLNDFSIAKVLYASYPTKDDNKEMHTILMAKK
jgi:ubiquinone/menaquinone biosynthesis C-methylase UbiE